MGKENPHRPHNEQPNRFPVPIEQVPDLTDFVYGEMPQALSLRPHEQTGCCNCDFKFDVARDMFADASAEVTVQFPKMICCFLAGMQSAPVEVAPKSGTTGTTYKGVMKKTFLPGCLGNDTTIVWEEVAGKPEMTFRMPSCVENIKTCLCQATWVGWRGTSESVPQTQALYDSSTIIRCSDACNLFCMQCKGCQNACCMSLDLAPRWTRPSDVRRLVSTKYDYEFAWRKLDEEISFEIAEGEVGELNVLRVLQPAHRVDALFTGRLYMDVKCMKPYVRFANKGEGDKSMLAAVDARYRGSVVHAQPSEEDHLIVLAGLIMHGLNTFPNKGNAPYRPGPADMFRGRLVPRMGGDGGASPSNAV